MVASNATRFVLPAILSAAARVIRWGSAHSFSSTPEHACRVAVRSRSDAPSIGRQDRPGGHQDRVRGVDHQRCPVLGALAQRATAPRALPGRPASEVRSSVLGCSKDRPRRGWNPIERASIRPRVVHVREARLAGCGTLQPVDDSAAVGRRRPHDASMRTVENGMPGAGTWRAGPAESRSACSFGCRRQPAAWVGRIRAVGISVEPAVPDHREAPVVLANSVGVYPIICSNTRSV